MIYFDNGATTYPKPMPVLNKAYFAMKYYSFNSGRSGYAQSLKAAKMIYDVREKTADMFNCSPENVVFTKNCTEALNYAIKGSVEHGGHIIISSLEHNSVARVAQKLSDDGVADYDIAEFSFDDDETVNNFERLIKSNTSAIVCMHSSNVFGVVFPITKIGKMCKKHGVRFIVDAAQSAGVIDIDMKRDNIDVLCCPGHKSLYGNMGTGFMCVCDGVKLSTVTAGGTGSDSLKLQQPDYMPDRFESGTLNNSGIISLGEGINFVNKTGIENIYTKEMHQAQNLYAMLSSIKGVKLYTPAPKYMKSVPIVSFNYKDKSSESVASYLADNDICVRAGFHCSPLAHRHFGTLKFGTVRVSLGAFNTDKECSKFYNIIKKM